MCLHSGSPQLFNYFRGISFVSSRPRDAKVNYSLAEQVQLDDNYTAAGSRGGRRPWELIRWFSSPLLLADAGWGGGGGLACTPPPFTVAEVKEAARDGKTMGGERSGR